MPYVISPFRRVGLLTGLALGLSFALSAHADPLDAYPPGSIKSEEQARAALEAASQTQRAAQAQFEREQAECYKRFFANRCREKAVARHHAAEQRVLAVEREAHDFERNEAVRQKMADIERKRLEAASEGNPVPEHRAVPSPAPAQAQPSTPRPPRAPKPRAQPHGTQQRGKPEAAPDNSAAERAQNVRDYEEKQRQAAEHAEAQARRKRERIAAREKKRRDQQAEETRRAQRRAAREAAGA